MDGSGRSESCEQDIEALRREIMQKLRRPDLDTELNGFLATQLASFNGRDTELVQRRLDAIEEALDDAALGVDRLLFGGSVAKHTYVDGLSDVDALVVLHDTEASPDDLVNRFTSVLRARLGSGDVLRVTAGRLAATITYRDGLQVQLLPAVERDGRTSIASEKGDSWRRISPHKFAEELTRVNQANGSAVIPTIKLAKAAIASLPKGHRLAGYHIEAIAVDAFREYSGRRDMVSMLRHLIGSAAEAVLRPTCDVTGQSEHIDEHLGPDDSARRWSMSTSLRRLAATLDNAMSVSDYRDLFNE
jgi:hypothetical protein